VLAPFLQAGDHVGIVPFTEPVEGMPWVRNAPAFSTITGTEQAQGLVDVVENIVGHEGELRTFTAVPPNLRANLPLREALLWAANTKDSAGGNGDENRGAVVVIAGSLYLVGDFYRYFGTYLKDAS
jgi:hypothetical protein